MKKENAAKSNTRVMYAFSFVFTIVLLLAFALDGSIPGGYLIRPLENKWADFRATLPSLVSADTEVNFRANIGKYFNYEADDKISIAAIDELTVDKLGYPFKRKHYATLIEKLNKAGVKAIGMDVLFFDSDREDVSSDKIMVDAVRRAGNVSALIAMDEEKGELKYPIKGLGEAASIISHPHVESTIESNGSVRSVRLFSEEHLYQNLKFKTRCGKKCAGVGIPLLAMATYAIYSGKPLQELEARYGIEPKLLNFRIPKSRPLHLGRDSKTVKDKVTVFRHISVLDIIEGKLSAEERAALKDGIVLVGSTALGAFDHYPSPYFASWPGVEVHSNAIDNLLHNDFHKPVAKWLVILVAIALVWFPALMLKYSIKAISIVSAAVIAVLMVVNYLALMKLYDMPYLSFLISLGIPFVFVTVYKAVLEGREKKWIKNTFGQYLSPKVVEVITKDPSKLSLGGEKRDMTAFFLDIAGFTTMSEKLTPEQLTQMLNEYLSGFTDIILRNDGVVDKYIGDCIMAFWNAPLDQKDHRRLACLAAIDCQAEMARLNKVLTQFEIKPSCRIGLNSGPMVVGNMGSRTRLSYTVMGDSVNLASRLEGANKYFHSKIMASEYTYDEAKDFVEARMLGQIRVVGKAIPVKVYELLAHKGKLPEDGRKLLAAYNEGCEAFFKGVYGPAKKAFEAALAVSPADGPSSFYLDLAVKYAAEVPKGWDGTFNLTSK